MEEVAVESRPVGAGEVLVDVVMGVDQPGGDQAVGGIEGPVACGSEPAWPTR